ncbi:MAG: hypothetical protein GY716_25835 [bacterium]|nr:hypothetical protein [bacterium]
MTTASAISCPACSFEQDEGTETCARCGIVFAKFERASESASEAAEAAQEAPQPIIFIERDDPAKNAWKLLGIGAVAALLAHFVTPIRFLLSPLVTLLHEFGHAAAAWLLGCPAIPSFDFVYGGGVTHHQSFQLPLALMLAGGWVWLGWIFRRNPRTLAVLGLVAGLWVVAVSAGWRRELVISAMGHGGELILAATFLYKALSGTGWRRPEIERPLGAFVAVFVQLQTMLFALRLTRDAAFMAWYKEGKGGAMLNDLELISLDFRIYLGIELSVEQAAGLMLLLSLIPPAIAVQLFVFRDPVGRFTQSLRRLRP